MSRSKHKHTAGRVCDCGCPAGDAFLCTDCTAKLGTQLRELPHRIAEAEDTAYRLDHVSLPGDGAATKGKTRPLPYRPEVGPLLDRARNFVTTWTRDTLETRGLQATDRWPAVIGPRCSQCTHQSCRSVALANRPIVPGSTAGMCDWLASRVDSIRLSPQVSDLAVAAHRLTTDLMAVTDLPPIPIYLGACDECRKPMYAARGAASHACKTTGCKHAPYVIYTRLLQLRKRAYDTLATAGTIATALTQLDAPVTEEKIRRWREGGKLLPRGYDRHRRPLYRIGDVDDLVTFDQERARVIAAKRLGKARLGVSH